jgi:hypothetical protein
MHVDAHFLELEYFNYDNVKPFKVSFSLRRFKPLKTYFSIWNINVFCVCNMVKHVLNILWVSHKNELQKWKVMIVFYVYFVQNGIAT